MPSPRTGTEDERRALIPWASEAVERVLRLFESGRPDATGPIERWRRAGLSPAGKIGVGAARDAAIAAHVAAREATGPAATPDAPADAGTRAPGPARAPST